MIIRLPRATASLIGQFPPVNLHRIAPVKVPRSRPDTLLSIKPWANRRAVELDPCPVCALTAIVDGTRDSYNHSVEAPVRAFRLDSNSFQH
jgi:hypothetical protein